MKETEQAQEEKKTVITFTVAECGEFHNLGEYHENITSVEEAIAVFNQIPPERMNGIRSIGINIHTEGTESYEDTQMDIVSDRTVDLEILDYLPNITDNLKVITVIAELIDKLPDIEVFGSLEQYKPLAKIEEFRNGKLRVEKEYKAGRVSIKEKLAEKKAVIKQRDKSKKEVVENEIERKSEREI